jgi:hypothetical protein
MPDDPTLGPSSSAAICGSPKPISGRKPLVCTQPPGHPGDHGPHDVVAIAPLSQSRPSPACGGVKPISGRSPLRCELAAGHAGDHAVRNALGEWLVRWSR